MSKTVTIKPYGYYLNTRTNVYHDPSRRFPNTDTICPMLQWLEYGKYKQTQADDYKWVSQKPAGAKFKPCGRCP